MTDGNNRPFKSESGFFVQISNVNAFVLDVWRHVYWILDGMFSVLIWKIIRLWCDFL